MTRLGTAVRMGLTELRRTPVLLALLVVAPAYVIYVFTVVAPDGAAVVHVGDGSVRTTLPEAFPAFTTPMTAALLAGIAGLFLMQTAATADSRLLVAGYRAREVVLARLVLVAALSLTAAGVSMAVMLTAFQPDRPGWFLLATTLTALLYGMVGLLVGVLLDRLLGVYVVLFGAMIDLFVFQNPLATDAPVLARALPGHFPLRVAMAAGFTGDIPVDAVAGTLAYLAALTALATAVFYRQTRVG